MIHEVIISRAMSSSIQKMSSASAGTAVALEWADGKKQLDHEQARQLAAEYDPNSPEEKQLVRKLDWRLVVSGLYFHNQSRIKYCDLTCLFQSQVLGHSTFSATSTEQTLVMQNLPGWLQTSIFPLHNTLLSCLFSSQPTSSARCPRICF